MSSIQDRNIIKEQYKNGHNLEIRISIHEKYSVNKKGFGNWIFEQYNIGENEKVLELGCGNGVMWSNKVNDIPKSSALILTDFSEGMLKEAEKNISHSDNISFQQVDIQNIPFEDEDFNTVIANMMLYHVPDINKGLAEVTRVLKNEGVFYCATYGEHGIVEYIQQLLGEYGVDNHYNKVFTLQNGEKVLAPYFSSIEKRIYEDHLEVTDVEDLIDYIFSLNTMIDFNKISRNELREVLEKKKTDGKIIIPKEYGMFIAKK